MLRAAALFLLLVPVSVQAQTAPPLSFAVKPSSAEEDPVARQQRLLDRMSRDERLFRHICRNCGLTMPGANAADSFDPAAALERR
jgi:hypothetical protein